MNKKVVLFVLVSSLLLLWMLSSLSIAFVKAVPEGIGVEENCLAKQDFADVASTVNVVFEEAHLPLYTIGGNPAYETTEAYSEFADYLVDHEYAVSTIDPGTTIDAGVLAPVDVLVIVAPQNSYSTSEIDAIEAWVKGGGRLLLISEWGNLGADASTIATRFGITLELDTIYDTDEYVINDWWPYYDGANLLSHPITAGVARVEMYSSDGITSAPADEIPLIVTDTDGTGTWGNGSSALGVSLMSALDGGTAGSGRLIVITDSNIWASVYDSDEDGDLDFYDSDNEILALNTVNWLASAAVELYYDDGTAEYEAAWSGAGGMYAVRFTPPAFGPLIGCSFYISSDPDTIMVHILDTDKNDLITPFSETPTSTGLFHVDLSTYGITVSQDVDFYVAMEYTAVYAPYLGIDTDDSDNRSWKYNGVDWSPYTDGDYMIRAVIEPSVVEGHFWDAKIENLVDDDGDGYYEQIDLGWDADTDLAELTVFVKIYGRYADGASQFIIQDDPYTIYHYDVDWRYVTLTDRATGLWDFRLELYDYDTDTLLDILDYEEDPNISNVPMDKVVEYDLTVQMPYPDVKVKIDGINYTTDADGKVQVTVSPGSCTVEVPTSISTGPSSRESFTQWSDGNQSNPRTVFVNSHLTLVAEYTTQYLVTFAQTGLDATATGTVVTVNGDAKTFSDLQYTTWVDSGDSISYSYSDLVSSSVEDKRFKLSDVTGPTSSITVTGPVTITGNYKTQYYLTMSKNFGTVTPGSGWYEAGSTVEISATAPSATSDEQYVWDGWTGTGSGSYSGMDNPASITMNGPVTETAAWIRKITRSLSNIPPLTFSAETIEIGGTITVSGSITPALETTVTLTYTKPDGSTFNKTVTSSSDGTFSQTYKPDAVGTWSVTASWSGDADHYGATSETKEFTVKPIPPTVEPTPTFSWDMLQVILAVVGIVLTVTIVGVAWFGTHRKRGHIKDLLDQIDDAFFRFQRNSRRCEAELYRLKDIVLEEYKSGTITEASYAVLNERIDDYLTKLS